jgi:uncharacterized sporulation protein YeaH/YhbH (DUF444 family)
MSNRIGSDVNRFKDIVKKKVKSNLGKYISSEKMIAKQGDKLISVPIDNIDLPRFTFGNNGNGGASQGDGEAGDPIDGQGKAGKGKKAGTDPGEHGFEAEFTPDELAQILGEELQLPALENKGKGKIAHAKNKYTGIGTEGAEGLRHFRRTFKESLKRNISSGDYNPEKPTFAPIKADKRYRTAKPTNEPNINTVVIYMLDCSGSMGPEEKHISKSVAFWINLWLKSQYKDIETRWLVHDSESKEVTQEEFFTISEAGGTQISSVYKQCAEIMEKDYPFGEWNVYPIHFSDGDNGGSTDTNEAIATLKNRIIPNSNSFSFGQISGYRSGFIESLDAAFGNEVKVNRSLMKDRSEIITCIKAFLGKGQ